MSSNQATLNNSVSPTTDIRDWWSLLKPRVMSLALFTAAIGYLGGSNHSTNPILALVTIFAIGLGAGAAGSLNQWFERNSDALMKRTRDRALPAGRLNSDDALVFTIGLTLAAVALLGLSSNWLAVMWYLVGFLLYGVIYTLWLKPNTVQNIVIGGIAGGLPPLIGWVAAAGEASVYAWLMVLVISVWTPSHFWALAIVTADDYKRAKMPMYPNVHGAKKTARAIFIYSLVLIPCAVAPFVLDGVSGGGLLLGDLLLGGLALALSAWFAWECFALLRNTTNKIAMRVFLRSIAYLFVLFALYTVEIIADKI